MTVFTLQTRGKNREKLTFFVPDNGGYVRLETENKTGTLAPQICYGGGYHGYTVTATPDTLAKEARRWWRSRRRGMMKA